DGEDDGPAVVLPHGSSLGARGPDGRASADRLDAHPRVVLAVAAKALVVLATAEVLDAQLDRGVFQDLADDLDTLDGRPADAQVVAVAVEQHGAELDGAARLDLAVIDRDHVPLADAVLPRTVRKHCVHR